MKNMMRGTVRGLRIKKMTQADRVAHGRYRKAERYLSWIAASLSEVEEAIRKARRHEKVLRTLKGLTPVEKRMLIDRLGDLDSHANEALTFTEELTDNMDQLCQEFEEGA